VTLRVLDLLRAADIIAAEDTRTARKLMDIHGVPLNGRRLVACHDHSGEGVIEGLVEAIAGGRLGGLRVRGGDAARVGPGFTLARAAIARGLPGHRGARASASRAWPWRRRLPADASCSPGSCPDAARRTGVPNSRRARRSCSTIAQAPYALV
jgi:16S rRNA (cytidine1402-2'-O)-methyltransferase